MTQGGPGARDGALRLRHLRAGLPRPPRGPGERAHRGLLRAAPRAVGPAAPRLARAGARRDDHRRAGRRRDDRLAPLARPVGALPFYVAGVVAAAAWVVPYAWMVATSFKTLPEIVAHPTAPLPEHLDLGAYREVFAAMPVARYMVVTVVMAGAIAAAQIALALPAGLRARQAALRGRALRVRHRARLPARAGAGHVRPGVSHVRAACAWSTR